MKILSKSFYLLAELTLKAVRFFIISSQSEPTLEERDKSNNIGKGIMQTIHNNKVAALVSKQQFKGA